MSSKYIETAIDEIEYLELGRGWYRDVNFGADKTKYYKFSPTLEVEYIPRTKKYTYYVLKLSRYGGGVEDKSVSREEFKKLIKKYTTKLAKIL